MILYLVCGQRGIGVDVNIVEGWHHVASEAHSHARKVAMTAVHANVYRIAVDGQGKQIVSRALNGAMDVKYQCLIAKYTFDGQNVVKTRYPVE